MDSLLREFLPKNTPALWPVISSQMTPVTSSVERVDWMRRVFFFLPYFLPCLTLAHSFSKPVLKLL